MTKIYILSQQNDAELEKLIYQMSLSQLRVFVYGIARGWDFDEAKSIAEGMVPDANIEINI